MENIFVHCLVTRIFTQNIGNVIFLTLDSILTRCTQKQKTLQHMVVGWSLEEDNVEWSLEEDI